MKKIFIIISLTLTILILCLFFNKENKIKVELDKCVDGDTAWFSINDKVKKYRFLSIDTMENNTDFGNITSEYVCNLLKSTKNIKIEYSKVGENRDKYDRELVFVYIDNILLQEKLINEGYAKLKYVFAKYEYIDKLVELENIAKDKKIGIWKNFKDNKNEKYYKLVYDNKEVKVKKNEFYIINNPKKSGCKFIGWLNNNKLFDMTTKINKNYKLKAKFAC